ncbi:hypothetical protein [Actinoplanes sp. NPDC020271]|uniref:hypothetical protein n=1 Tax=Actinoplanes sp. NPDC020271 TaxID=3363896 RepID=UPI00379D4927
MAGLDAGVVPQLLCVADATPAALAGGLCLLVVSLFIGIAFWLSRTPGRVSFGRWMCLGAVVGFVAHWAVALSRFA